MRRIRTVAERDRHRPRRHATATGGDPFVASLDTASAPRFGRLYGTSAVTTALAVDGSTLVAVGNFAGTIDLGGGTLAASGSSAFFVAYLAR